MIQHLGVTKRYLHLSYFESKMADSKHFDDDCPVSDRTEVESEDDI